MRRSALLVVSVLVSLAVLVLAGPAGAVPIAVKAPQIGFGRDETGGKPNGFTSADNSATHFSDSIGEDLDVYNASPEAKGKGLGVFDDDNSELVMTFDVPMRRISLLFGNDDPTVVQDGDRAGLEVFRNGNTVGSAFVETNNNDLGDQRIGIKGVTFREARFVYLRGDTALDLIEVVDNIRLSPRCTIVGDGGPNTLVGSSSANVLCGFKGNDRLRARGGNDFVDAGAGNDRLRGGPGGDTLVGGAGNDVIRAVDGSNTDTVYGGPGNDTCYVDQTDDATKGCEEVIFPILPA